MVKLENDILKLSEVRVRVVVVGAAFMIAPAYLKGE